MKELSIEMLYDVNGGDQSDYDAGYTVGKALRSAWNAVSSWCSDAWNTVKSWF